jgi:glycosyltransferase involved in cell wall biosynthesis
MSHSPLVSVALITYQHRPTIEQAIESVWSQVTHFPIEIVIGEDGSTDGTLDVCLAAERTHPDIVRVLQHGHLEKIRVRGRITGRRNWLLTVGATRGRYLAILDGDDHWTRPDKLQRQVDFLESHPDHAFCFTDM